MEDEYDIAVWVSSDGKTKLISNMPTKYIWNCLNKLNTQLTDKPDFSDVDLDSLSDYEQEALVYQKAENDKLEKKILNKISQFEAELRKRGEIPS